MQEILEMLKNGDKRIVGYFVEANKLWGEILWKIDAISVNKLAEELFHKQHFFEKACGGDLLLGKIVMAWSGFAHLYSCRDGFGENGPGAYKLSQAFHQSKCSIEVKNAAKRAVVQYSVEDYS